MITQSETDAKQAAVVPVAGPKQPAEILISTSDGVEWEIHVENPNEVPLNAVGLERAWFNLQRKLHAIQQTKIQEWQLAQQSAKEITNA